MGCIFSIFSTLIKVVISIVKTVAKIIVALIMFFIKIGLLLPLVMACVGFGLWVGGTEWMTPGNVWFVLYLVGLGLLTVACLLRKLKKAMDKHNEKYDENGKRIK